ncbi:aKG-HExxH-type peptide beta-hydroxylase [Bradyrhizobium sp.]|uniref:aKG-HExxH-type peptide beta-hydroxylase n=1 Tax=Bradyrhizobium sp. TaxID=376 RepID=UPI0039E373C1
MFIPGSTEAASLDARMRRSLADSLAHIHDVAGRELDVSSSAASRACEGISNHRIEPGIFGRYYKLVPAIERGDAAEASRLFRAIADAAETEPTFAVVPFSEAALGQEQSLYRELVEARPDGSHWLTAPALDRWNGFDRKVDRALDIIERVDAPLARELRGLIVRIAGASAVEGHVFGGASSFMLWGLLILSVETYGEVSLLTEGLVHEAAHQLLFAYSIDEPLVSNPLAECYPSPLRRDARPMDGIYHATFVTARLHYWYRKLREAAPEHHSIPIDMIDGKLSTYRDLYWGGSETIEKFGMLTDTGRRILDETNDYMKAA